jgi:hypothetical protein
MVITHLSVEKSSWTQNHKEDTDLHKANHLVTCISQVPDIRADQKYLKYFFLKIETYR